MIISFNWLKEYLDTDLSAEQISAILTDIGLEVEKLERAETVRGGLCGVVVGEVISCEKHADADRLKVTTVSVGGGEPLQIVCGAPNVAVGQKVAVATVDTTLYPWGSDGGLKIKRSKIRGVESMGMICAEDELGISPEHGGIMVVDENAVAGTPVREYLGIEDDYIFEIGLTPNRIDAASHYGVARDLAAYLKSHDKKAFLSLPPVDDFAADTKGMEIKVEVVDHGGAPRYAGVTVSGIKIAPSPQWLQERLRSIGINPKNNVVDITNFVLHETGHPLHAFDAGRIDGGRIVVRTYPEGTVFTTLDGVERRLSAEDLMISSVSKPLCIAGVLGGIESGIGDATAAVFIESAYFNPQRIRRTAKRHGINTDASFRFERGADPDMAIYALKRAAILIRELAGGKVTSGIIDIYPERIEPFRVELSFDRVNSLTGKEIPREEVRKIIESLSITIERETESMLSVSVPPFRVDVRREVDLIEEILRIYGYNHVESPSRMSSSLSYASKPDMTGLTNTAADFLSANGFNEIMGNSLTKASYYEGLESYPAENCVRMLNPLSADLGVMRQTLLFNAMEAVQLNANHRNPDLRLYEFGNCYSYDPSKKGEGGLAPYTETPRLAITVTGAWHAPSWNAGNESGDFFRLRAVAEKLLARFGIDIYSLKTETSVSDIFSEALSMRLDGKELLQMGVVSEKIRRIFDLRAEVYFLEINFAVLARAASKHGVRFAELSKYPEAERDLALLIDKNMTFSKLRETAFSTERKLLKSVSLFDVYEGEKLPEGKKSYALRFVIEDKTKTLTDAAIDRIMNNLISAFERECGASIRQ